MKFITTLALIAATAIAIPSTSKDCLAEEGATIKGGCRSLWYKYCDKLTIPAEQTCNVDTNGDASISWFSERIQV